MRAHARPARYPLAPPVKRPKDDEMPLFDRVRAEPPPAREVSKIFRVSELNRAVRSFLEGTYGNVWVEGELSDVTRSTAGHVYFSLNDEADPAQVKGVIFRNDAIRTRAKLVNGARVRFRGRLSLYEPRGTFQLIASIALPAGEGDLALELERRKRKLEAEGLFAQERKRVLPRVPRLVGVVTSTTGAALHDILRVAKDRCPVRFVVADCRVQGAEAPASIVSALELVSRVPGLDVIVVGRGGGSAEDLFCFNDEAVVRAITRMPVPVVSAVGHEVDVSLSDLAADVRAATPSNAAELVVPDRRALVASVRALEARLVRGAEIRVGKERLRVERLERRLSAKAAPTAFSRRAVDGLEARLRRAMAEHVARERADVARLAQTLARHDPRSKLALDRAAVEKLTRRLERAARQTLVAPRKSVHEAQRALEATRHVLVPRGRAKVAALAASLDALSPLRVLDRGYAIALHAETGRAVRKREDVAPGDAIELRVSDGSIKARVED